MVDPRFGAGPPSDNGLPAPDAWAEDCAEQAKSGTAALAEAMARWFGDE